MICACFPRYHLESKVILCTAHGILTSVDTSVISPKQAKLQLLSLASHMDPYKANVIEGVADSYVWIITVMFERGLTRILHSITLTKLPPKLLADRRNLGEVGIQTRHYASLLSSTIPDTTKKVVLKWSNKMDESAAGIWCNRLDIGSVKTRSVIRIRRS
ncbi:hypothetical protein BJV82DRAFT_601183 [Fennellomyces sp. T-0311]|nr:hypothetical protein BJV82DRAFT_601183 [Fennellomyces sp. T-0311]